MRLIICRVNHIEEPNQEARYREACLDDDNQQQILVEGEV